MRGKKRWVFFSKRLFEVLKKEKRTKEYVNAMFVRGNREKELFNIWRKRTGIVVMLIIICGFTWLYCFTTESEESVLSEGKYVVRQPEEETVDIQVSGKSDAASWEKNISLLVKEKEFTDGEKKEIEKKVDNYVKKKLPGKNTTLQKVTRALNFVTEIPGTEAELKWTWDEQYIKDSGTLIADAVPEQGADTEIMLEAKWKNWRKVFYYRVHIEPRIFTKEEMAIQAVKKEMKNVLKEKAEEAVVELPGQIGNTKVTYRTMEEKSYMPVYLCIGMILLLPFIWQEQQKKKLAEREEQMLMEHPGIVNKVMLLLSAGLTVRKAVERLAEEYEEERKKGGSIRYAYEEICVMQQEMKDGMSEGKAMERFGKRCRLFPYLRFSSVITQNLKKGAEGIIDILEKESMEALEQRRSRVLKMGEMAGTKLLFPMMLMLGLVMGIIMVPAFMTM